MADLAIAAPQAPNIPGVFQDLRKEWDKMHVYVTGQENGILQALMRSRTRRLQLGWRAYEHGKFESMRAWRWFMDAITLLEEGLVGVALGGRYLWFPEQLRPIAQRRRWTAHQLRELMATQWKILNRLGGETELLQPAKPAALDEWQPGRTRPIAVPKPELLECTNAYAVLGDADLADDGCDVPVKRLGPSKRRATRSYAGGGRERRRREVERPDEEQEKLRSERKQKNAAEFFVEPEAQFLPSDFYGMFRSCISVRGLRAAPALGTCFSKACYHLGTVLPPELQRVGVCLQNAFNLANAGYVPYTIYAQAAKGVEPDRGRNGWIQVWPTNGRTSTEKGCLFFCEPPETAGGIEPPAHWIAGRFGKAQPPPRLCHWEPVPEANPFIYGLEPIELPRVTDEDIARDLFGAPPPPHPPQNSPPEPKPAAATQADTLAADPQPSMPTIGPDTFLQGAAQEESLAPDPMGENGFFGACAESDEEDLEGLSVSCPNRERVDECLDVCTCQPKRIVKVLGDGNCLYRCVAGLVHGLKFAEGEHYKDVRKCMAAAAIEEGTQLAREHAKMILDDFTWGETHFLRYACAAYGLTFHVFVREALIASHVTAINAWQTLPGATAKCGKIYYSGNHFDIVTDPCHLTHSGSVGDCVAGLHSETIDDKPISDVILDPTGGDIGILPPRGPFAKPLLDITKPLESSVADLSEELDPPAPDPAPHSGFRWEGASLARAMVTVPLFTVGEMPGPNRLDGRWMPTGEGHVNSFFTDRVVVAKATSWLGEYQAANRKLAFRVTTPAFHLCESAMSLYNFKRTGSAYLYAVESAGGLITANGDNVIQVQHGAEVLTYNTGPAYDTIRYVRSTRGRYELVDCGVLEGPVTYRLFLLNPRERFQTWRDMLRLPETFVRFERREQGRQKLAQCPNVGKTEVTIACTVAAAHLPEDERYIPNLLRVNYAANEWRVPQDPTTAVARAVAYHRCLSKDQWTRMGFGVTPQDPKACASCGRSPPEAPYRWRNRLCQECKPRGREQKYYVTTAGLHIWLNFDCGTAYPGQVCIPGEQFYPPQSKLDRIDWKSADLEIALELVSPTMQASPDFHCYQGRVAVMEHNYRQLMAHLFEQSAKNPGVCRLKLVGVGVSGCRPTVPARTIFIALKAVLTRAMLTPETVPEPGIFLDCFLPFMREHFLPLFRFLVRMMDEAWLSHMPARRRRPLTDACREYQENGLEKADLEFKSFPKSEKGPAFTVLNGTLAPIQSCNDRLICGPSDKSHAVAGPWIRPALQVLKDFFNYKMPVFYASTCPRKLQNWLERVAQPGRRAIWLDLSCFDNSYSDQAWDLVELTYKQYVHDPDFWRVLAAWRKPKANCKGLFYQMRRTVNASGRDDTAYANGLLNSFVVTWSVVAAYVGCSVREVTWGLVMGLEGAIDMAYCGDDTLGFVTERQGMDWQDFSARVNKNIAAFGFWSKGLCSSHQYEKAVFLANRPLRVGGRWTWVKTLGRALYKMGWRMDPKGDDRAWYLGVCQQVTVACKNAPVYYDIAARVTAITAGCKVTPYRPERGLDQGRFDLLDSPLDYPNYDEQTLQDLASAYTCPEKGFMVTVADVKACIARVSLIRAIPVVLDDPFLKICMETDEM